MLSHEVANWVSQYGGLAIFCLLALGVIGLPIPDELLMVYAGSLIFRGRLELAPTALAAYGGAVMGISTSYALGRIVGKALLRYGSYVHLTPARVERTHAWFERIGKWTLVIGYFIPGVRHLTAFLAGSSKLHLGALLFAYVGAALWVGTFLTIGYCLGEEWHRYSGQIVYAAWFVAGAAVVLALVVWAVYAYRRSRPQRFQP